MQLNYWLGLNKLATERGGDDALIVRPDDESEADPEDIGWFSMLGDTVEYVTDASRGKVFHSVDADSNVWTLAMLGDHSLDDNPNDTELNISNHILSAWIKSDGSYVQLVAGAMDTSDSEYTINIVAATGYLGTFT